MWCDVMWCDVMCIHKMIQNAKHMWLTSQKWMWDTKKHVFQWVQCLGTQIFGNTMNYKGNGFEMFRLDIAFALELTFLIHASFWVQYITLTSFHIIWNYGCIYVLKVCGPSNTGISQGPNLLQVQRSCQDTWSVAKFQWLPRSGHTSASSMMFALFDQTFFHRRLPNGKRFKRVVAWKQTCNNPPNGMISGLQVPQTKASCVKTMGQSGLPVSKL